MPTCSNTALWRNSTYRFQGYLYLDQPPTVFQCQVDGGFSITYPVDAIRYNNVTIGAYTDVEVGQTVLFGSAPGLSDQGRTRIKATPTSNTLYIGRVSVGTSDGEGNLFPGITYMTVLDEWRVWAKVPYIADGITPVTGHGTPALGVIFKDGNLDFATYGVNAYPIVNIGGGCAYANYVNPGTGVITLSLNAAALSLFIDGSASTWLWNVKDGTITSGSTTTAAITVTFPPGRRIISLTATDTNGNSTTRPLLVVACDDSTITPIKAFDATGNALEINKPREFNVHVLENIPRSTFPDQCYVIYFEAEFYNNTQGSLNVSSDITNAQTGFEHIKFAGWHYTDENIGSASDKGSISDVNLKCLDAVGWLNVLPGFPFEQDRASSPTSWLYQHSANLDRYWWFILYQHSTALNVTDYYARSSLGLTADDYGFARLGSDGQSLFEQIFKLSQNAIDFLFGGNELGQIYVRPDPLILNLSDRTSTVIVSLSQDDLADIKFTNEHFPRAHWDRGAAIVATTVDVASLTTVPTSFMVAPGLGPGQGLANNDKNEQLVKNSSEHAIRTGNRHARINSNFSYLELTLIQPGDAGFDPAYGEWVDLTLDAAYAAQRGITFTSARLLIRKADTKISVSNKGNEKQIVLTCEVETSGPAAVLDPQPQSSAPVSPLSVMPVLVVPPTTGPGTSGGSTPTKTGGWVLRSSDTQVWIASNFPGTPLFRDVTPTLGAGFKVKHSVLQIGGTRAWVLASDGTNSKVFTTSNVFALPTVSWSAGANITGVWTTLRQTSVAGKIGIENPAGSTCHLGTFTHGTGSNTITNTGVNTWHVVVNAYDAPLNLYDIWLYFTTIDQYNGRCCNLHWAVSNMSGWSNASGATNNGGLNGDAICFGTTVFPFGLAANDGWQQYYIANGYPSATIAEIVVNSQSSFSFDVAVTGSDAPGQPQVAFSADNGATWGSPINYGAGFGPNAGFDTQYAGTVSYFGTQGKTGKATTLGGSYSDDQSFTANPLLVEIPWSKRNSIALDNTGSSPQYIVGLDAPDGSGHTLYWIVGGSPVNITPSISGNPGVAVGPNCLATYLGKYIAYLGSFGGTTHLVTSADGGATWTDRGAVDSTYIRVRRLASSVGQLYLDGNSLDYSASFGAVVVSKTKPSSAAGTSIEAYY